MNIGISLGFFGILLGWVYSLWLGGALLIGGIFLVAQHFVAAEEPARERRDYGSGGVVTYDLRSHRR
jgi:hypothetical protein